MVIQKEGKKEDFELPESQKYKLTLGIDREVVRRAKMQDINISFWTEQLLKIMTFDKKEIKTSHEDVVQTHYIFLSEVTKLLEKYELEGVNIGGFDTYYERQIQEGKLVGVYGHSELVLVASGKIYEEEYDDKGNPLEISDYISAYIDTHKDELKGLTYDEVIDRYQSIDQSHKLDKETISNFLRRGIIRQPIQIIENLLYQMTQSSKVNKEKIKEMNIALRILKMMSENGGNNGDKVSQT